MRPPRAAIAPASTIPRPGCPGASVARRAFSQIVSTPLADRPASTHRAQRRFSLGSPVYRIDISVRNASSNVRDAGGPESRALPIRSRRKRADAGGLGVRRPGHDRGASDRRGRDRRRRAGRRRAARDPGRRRSANLHSHAFQRAMAGLAEIRGAGDRHVLDLARDDVPLRADDVAGRRRGGRRPGSMSRCWRPASPRSPNSTISTTRPTARPMPRPRRWPGASSPPPADRHRPDAAAGLLRARELRRRAAEAGAAAVHHRPRRLRAPLRRLPPAGRGKTGRGARRRAAQPARRDARANSPTSSPFAGDGPIHIHVAEQVKEVEDCVAWSGARPVRWLLDHAGVDERWCLVHATHMDERETRDLARSGAVAGLCPVTEANLGDGIFNAAAYLAPADASASAPTRTSASASPANCGSSNIPSGCARGRATSARPPADRPGRAISTRSGRRRAGAGARPRPARGRRAADLVTLRADHPTLAGKADDADPRRLDLQRRKRARRLRLERRPQGRRRRSPRLQGPGRGAIRDDDARAQRAADRPPLISPPHRRPPSSSMWTSRSAGSS